MKKILIIILLLSSILVKAQDKKQVAQPDSVIKVIPIDGRHSGYVYTIDGKLQTREDVIIRLMAYAPSAVEVKKAKTDITWAYISTGGVALSSLAAGIEFAKNNKNAGVTLGTVDGKSTFIYPKHSLTGAYVFSGIATGFLIAGIVHIVNGAKHADRALKAYNKRFE